MSIDDAVLLAIACIVFLCLAVIAGILLSGRGAKHIFEYLGITEDRRENYDCPALCRIAGAMLLLLCVIIPVISLGAAFDIFWLALCGVISCFLVVALGIYCIRACEKQRK